MEYIKKNLKTKSGRKLLFIEGIVIAIGIAVLFMVLPTTITVPTYLVLLIILYVFVSGYMLIKKTTDKSLNNKDGNDKQ
jgi:phosphatidylserine synthase